jgi:hypothetical protein
MIAEVAWFNRILSGAELTFLNPSAGVWRSPAFLSGLVEYVHFNQTIGTPGNMTGAPSVTGCADVAHPTVLYPWGVRRALHRRRRAA